MTFRRVLKYSMIMKVDHIKSYFEESFLVTSLFGVTPDSSNAKEIFFVNVIHRFVICFKVIYVIEV